MTSQLKSADRYEAACALREAYEDRYEEDLMMPVEEIERLRNETSKGGELEYIRSVATGERMKKQAWAYVNGLVASAELWDSIPELKPTELTYWVICEQFGTHFAFRGNGTTEYVPGDIIPHGSLWASMTHSMWRVILDRLREALNVNPRDGLAIQLEGPDGLLLVDGARG